MMVWAFCGAAAVLGQPDRDLANTIAAIKAKTSIPVRLPTTLPDLGQGSDRLYWVVDKSGAAGYSVLLAFTQDCNGASFCRAGTLTGARAAERITGARRVSLAKGIRGEFSDSFCAAGCSDAVVRWSQNGVFYSAGVKGGSSKDAIVLANAVIAAQAK